MLTATQLTNATDAELEALAARIARELKGRRVLGQEKPNREVVGRRSSPRGTLQREYVRCGKKNCRKCAEGPAHGPYWYHYFYKNGRLTSRYVGKEPKEEHRERFPELFGPPEAGEDRT